MPAIFDFTAEKKTVLFPGLFQRSSPQRCPRDRSKSPAGLFADNATPGLAKAMGKNEERDPGKNAFFETFLDRISVAVVDRVV
jgi:hypothetical protein